MRTPNTFFQDLRTRKTRTLIALLTAMTVVVAINVGPRKATATPAATQTEIPLSTTEAPMLAGTFQQIGKQEGPQLEARIDGNLVSYTDYSENSLESRVRYFDLATNTDHLIPGDSSSSSSSSSVNGGRIAFHEVLGPGAFQTVVFDPVSQTRTLVIPGAGLPAIGGNLVAFLKPLESERDFEIETYDLNTGLTTRLTNDHLFDSQQQISPSGNAVVWRKCNLSGFNCDIYSAIQTSAGVFTTRALTGPDSEDVTPNTNGEIAVYLKRENSQSEVDIYFQPVEGGEETRLQIPLHQQDVKVAGNLIAFDSLVEIGPNDFQLDVFVYDISTAMLSRVTNTPSHEWLNDFSISNGVGRIVYMKEGESYGDLYAFTFPLPDSPEEQIEGLTDLIDSFNLPPGTANGLIAKLQDALTAIAAGDTATACDSLASFIKQCRAQSGKKLTTDQANQLINAASQIETELGCS